MFPYFGGSHMGVEPQRRRAPVSVSAEEASVSGKDAESASFESHCMASSGFEYYGFEHCEAQEYGARSLAGQGAKNGSAIPRKPLRVIVVFPCLLRGGAEQWLVYLAKFLDPKRAIIERCIVTNSKAIDPQFAKEMPIPVEVRQPGSIERAVRECEVLFVFGLPLDTLLEQSRPKLCVFTAHGCGNWTKGLLARSRGLYDHVVAVSKNVKSATCVGIPTTVISNGIDAARIAATRSRASARQRFGFQDADFVLGYMGRYSPEKQVQLLIRAAAKLPARYKLLLVGWGPERAMLMDLANELIPGRYAFATAVDYLGDYYGAMDAFGLVSLMEGCSLALLEAMMSRVPVVVTAVGSVPELIVDGTSGIVVSANSSSIAKAVRRLGEHPEWASGLAAEGQRIANQQGHAARMARDYEALLHKLWQKKFG